MFKKYSLKELIQIYKVSTMLMAYSSNNRFPRLTAFIIISMAFLIMNTEKVYRKKLCKDIEEGEDDEVKFFFTLIGLIKVPEEKETFKENIELENERKDSKCME